ncbi:MAG: GGDEF domain-containing protein [Candidatus Moraniibacteriota bacterium]
MTHCYETYFPGSRSWFTVIIPVIEIGFPSLVVCLLWSEIGQLRGESHTDTLTGLLNRRGVEEALIEEVSKRQQSLRGMTIPFPPFGVIGIDLDNFKKVNDTFGHSAGDNVLVTISEDIKSVFGRSESGSDVICRTGGDEFLAVLANTGPEETMKRAEMLREVIDADHRLHFIDAKGVPFNVTASIGVSALDGIIETSRVEEVKAVLHNAIMAADRSTYVSKKNGRNSVSDKSTHLMLVG